MAENEINEGIDKVERSNRGDRTSENTADDAVIGGDRPDHQEHHQEMKDSGRTFHGMNKLYHQETGKQVDDGSGTPDGESVTIVALNPDGSEVKVSGKTRLNENDLVTKPHETQDQPLEAIRSVEHENMTTTETKTFGGSNAKMMFDAISEMPDGPAKTEAWESVKKTYTLLAQESNTGVGDSGNGVNSGSGEDSGGPESYTLEKQSNGKTLIKTGVSDYNLGQVYTRLPPDYQKKIIEAFQKGSQVGQDSIHETAEDILKQTTEGYIEAVRAPFDLLMMGGKGLLSILEFERDLIFNPEEANRKAAVAGENIGYALVGGIKLFTGLSAYGTDVQQSGDYTRPFKDLGNALNKWYDGLTPGDQMHVMASISAGFGIGAAAGQLRSLAKPGAFAEFLEETVKAVPQNPEAQAKAAGSIKKVIEAFSKSKKPLTPALETGVVESGVQGLKSQMDRASKALQDKFDELNHKMTGHKPEGRKGKWEAAKEAREADIPAPRSLDNIQSRDWYNARVAEIDDFEQQMKDAGKSSKEIFDQVFELRNKAKQQARDLMKDRVKAKELDRDFPLHSRQEVLAKYGHDYDKAIAASKRTNSKVNQQIERLRKRKDS